MCAFPVNIMLIHESRVNHLSWKESNMLHSEKIKDFYFTKMEIDSKNM